MKYSKEDIDLAAQMCAMTASDRARGIESYLEDAAKALEIQGFLSTGDLACQAWLEVEKVYQEPWSAEPYAEAEALLRSVWLP